MEPLIQNFNKYTVAVRVRPPSNQLSPISFSIPNPKAVTELRPTSIVTYSFDQVFGPQNTNELIFNQSLRQFVEKGISKNLHSTILAYGQTGSGKTHTLFGHQNNGLIHYIGKEIFTEEQQYKITCSVLQIYNQKITDLVTNNEIRLLDDSKGNLIIQGLEVTQIKSFQQFQLYLKNMSKNKIFGNSYIHSESSRSHVLLTLRINGKHINIVDLCGSEVLTYNFNEKQRQQTNNINLSLFTLNSVLAQICDNRNKHIPYRNSVLTRLLKNSLSAQRTCQIYMMCTIAPQAQHIEMSRKTLRFGQLAIQIDENGVKEEIVNLSEQKRQSKKVKNIIDKKLDVENAEYKKIPWETNFIRISGEDVKIYKLNWDSQSKQTIVFLHAYGYNCDGTDWNVFVNQICYKFPKIKMLSIDFPGFGESTGKKFTSRSQKFNEKGQPIDFMKALFSQLKLTSPKKLTLIGYDLGGAISLSCCLDPMLSKLIENVICFHPTWTDNIQNLSSITQRVLLQWMNVQTFHLVSAGQKMSKIIKNAVLYRYNIGVYSDEKVGGYYDRYAKSMVDSMCQFILESSHFSVPIYKDKKVSDRGKVTEVITITQLSKQQEQLNKAKESIKELFSLISTDKHKQVYQSLLRTSQNTPKFTRLAGNLLQLSPSTMTFDALKKLDVIKELPKNYDIIKEYPMFSCGRQLQVKTTVELNMFKQNQYLKFKKDGDIAATHLAWVAEGQNQQQILSKQKIFVNLLKVQGGFQKISLQLKNVVELNQSTPFSIVNGDYVFQDSVTCKYSSSFMKLKMFQCLFHTSHLIEKLSFSNNNQDLLELQKKIAKIIVKQIDLRHLVHEGIDNTRYTGTDVGKLAYRGQGNCHHLASVGAALLLPFGKMCGWDVIFRAGSCLKTGRQLDSDGKPIQGWNGKPKINVQDHTWLQVVFKPSLEVVIFDPTFEFQNYPLQQMYAPFQFHISGKPQCVYGQRQIKLPKLIYDQKRPALEKKQ